MNSIPVDLSRLTGLLCVAAPEPKTDLDGEQRRDRDGNHLWVTGIAVRRAGTRKASVIDVQTSAEPEGVTEGSPVGVTELDVSLWEIEGRHGLSYKPAAATLHEPEPTTAEPVAPVNVATPGDLVADVGHREDGQRWVIDLATFPHWLITGATQSGKSTLINAAVAQWATRPVALVGIDCKGGMELAPHAPRLSALATDRAEAADILAALVAVTQRRMGLCRQHGARNIWQLPPQVRPVPVVVIVDELAELYLVASRADKDEALRATTNLLRLAQLGAALGVHVIVAGQRVGSDFGPGVTALRAQLAGRICLRVNDEETVKMTLGDLYPDAVDAAQQIDPAVKGIAVTTADEAGWIRARSVYLSPQELAAVIAATAHLAPVLPGLTPPAA